MSATNQTMNRITTKMSRDVDTDNFASLAPVSYWRKYLIFLKYL